MNLLNTKLHDLREYADFTYENVSSEDLAYFQALTQYREFDIIDNDGSENVTIRCAINIGIRKLTKSEIIEDVDFTGHLLLTKQYALPKKKVQ